MATKDRSGSQPLVNFGGSPLALNSEHIAALHEIVSERAQASLAEIAGELERRCGVHVCEATIRRALRAEGIVRLKAKRRVYPTADKGPKRYGYTAAHRREDVPFYSTNLTDAEWDLVADLFERAPGQGVCRHITVGGNWSTLAPMSCAQAAPGDYCPQHFPLGRLSTKLLCAGLPLACSNKCRIESPRFL